MLKGEIDYVEVQNSTSSISLPMHNGFFLEFIIIFLGQWIVYAVLSLTGIWVSDYSIIGM